MAEQAHQSGTEAPGGQHGAFPPFNAHTFPSQIVWLVISFVLLYALMAKWALPQVAGVVEGRQKGIANDLAEADKLKRQSEEAIANETREKQAAEAEATRKRLEDELNRKLAESEKTIAATKQAAMANVRGIAEETASAIVERLIGAAPGQQAVANAVADVLKD